MAMTEEASKAKVVTLYGDPIAVPGEINPNIIKIIEMLMSRAERGDIMTLAVSFQLADKSFESHHAGDTSCGLIGALERLKQRLL